MPKPFQRTSRYKRKSVRVPSGRPKQRFVERKNKPVHVCAICKSPLTAVSEEGAKTEKRPSRKFAGVLCHVCLDRVLRYASRIHDGTIKMDDVPIKFRQFVSMVDLNE